MNRNTAGLGVYMRDIAKRLHSTIPMTAKEAAMHMSTRDVPYASMVLMRLEMRGIATEVDGSGYIRGPVWGETAERYKWS